jgi:hypothetical protein
VTEEQAYVEDASNAAQVEKAETAERMRRKQELNDLRLTLSTIEGRRVIWRILSECNIFDNSMLHRDAMYWEGGKKAIGTWLYGEVTQNFPEAWVQMQLEAKEAFEQWKPTIVKKEEEENE